MTTDRFDDSHQEPVLTPQAAAQVASLDAVGDGLVDEARSWAARLGELSGLAARADRAGPQTRRTLALELAGSWRIGQLTAERWIAEAERFYDALPQTLSMLTSGELLAHQAKVLLHRTAECTPQVAGKVEAEVLPDGAGLCPSDLARRVDRVRLRIESELSDAAEAAERQEAAKAARRRTWLRPTEDGMAVAGALLTPAQGVAWAAGMDALERRERLADRAAGISRTAEQRRADLFAALPTMVLAGSAQDDAWRRTAVVPGGRPEAPRAPRPGGGESQEPPFGGPLLDEPLLQEAGPVPPPWTFSPEQVCGQLVLNIHVPVSTVLDLSQEPGSLDGYGAVSAEHIRLLRPTSFRRVMAEALTGRPVAVDDKPTPADPDPATAREQVQAMLRPDVIVDAEESQHDPSARLARLIDLRDVRCCGPGCSSSRCDRDHLEPWPTGPTSARNLGLASPRCHSAKHHGWNLARHPDGNVTWHSPLHRSYDRPGPWSPPPRVDLTSLATGRALWRLHTGDAVSGQAPRTGILETSAGWTDARSLYERRSNRRPCDPDPSPPPDEDHDSDRTLLDALQPPKPASPAPPPAPPQTWDDDPPF